MGNIEKISKIRKETLSGEYYFQSLLEQACLSGLIPEARLRQMQSDCLSLLAKVSETYNNGDSSSIRVDAAQNLLSSILFTIGVWLKTYPDPDDAAAAVRKDGVGTLYQKGRERIDRMIKSTKRIHFSIVANLVKTENIFYRSTIVDGINGFFKLYNPEFSAQEIHITADYPVHHPMERLQGIEFIRKYLECIYFENQFCSRFSEEDLHHLLCGYDEHYEQLLFNLYEPVLTAAIGCVLTGKDARGLDLAPSSVKMLYGLFQGKTRAEIEGTLAEAAGRLAGLLELSKPVMHYIYGSLPQIASAIESAVTLHTLDRIFLLRRYPENNPKLVVSYGNKMEDEKYRKILEEILACRYFSDKKALIKSEIRSLADLEDILQDAELSEEEIFGILDELGPAEIAALAKKYPLPSAVDRCGMREGEITLCECLQKYISALPGKQQGMVRHAEVLMEG